MTPAAAALALAISRMADGVQLLVERALDHPGNQGDGDALGARGSVRIDADWADAIMQASSAPTWGIGVVADTTVNSKQLAGAG